MEEVKPNVAFGLNTAGEPSGAMYDKNGKATWQVPPDHANMASKDVMKL
jgi:hypothetical protein